MFQFDNMVPQVGGDLRGSAAGEFENPVTVSHEFYLVIFSEQEILFPESYAIMAWSACRAWKWLRNTKWTSKSIFQEIRYSHWVGNYFEKCPSGPGQCTRGSGKVRVCFHMLPTVMLDKNLSVEPRKEEEGRAEGKNIRNLLQMFPLVSCLPKLFAKLFLPRESYQLPANVYESGHWSRLQLQLYSISRFPSQIQYIGDGRVRSVRARSLRLSNNRIKEIAGYAFTGSNFLKLWVSIEKTRKS